MGVSEAAESLLGAGDDTSFSLPLEGDRRLSAGGLISEFTAGSEAEIEDLLTLIDPETFAGDAARTSFSMKLGCGLRLGFLLGEARARISSSSSNSSNRSFFLFTGATVSDTAVDWRCFFEATSLSFSFSMAITSSNRSKEPSSTTAAGGVSAGLGFRPLCFTKMTVFGVPVLSEGAGGVARGAVLPPIFSFGVGVEVAPPVDAAGVACAFVGAATVFAWIGTGGGGICLG